jgi:hypothetical protein
MDTDLENGKGGDVMLISNIDHKSNIVDYQSSNDPHSA